MGEKNEIVSVEQAVALLDKLADGAPGLIAKGKSFTQALAVAKVITDIRKALLVPGVMDNVMQLMGSPLGFQTDRDRGEDNKAPYTKEEVLDPLIDAVCMGLKPVGNEFNIISKKCYPAKNGFTNRLREMAGLWYKDIYGIPALVDNGAVIHVNLEWTYKKKKGSVELDFAVRVNKGMGADAIKGKAERKARAWLYNHLTGNNLPDGDVSDTPLIPERSITKPDTSAPEEIKKDAPLPSEAQASQVDPAAPQVVFATITQALAFPIGGTFNVRGFLVDTNTRTVSGGKKITTYTLAGPDSANTIKVQYWDAAKPGAVPDGETRMTFLDVSIGTYNGKPQYTAKEVKVG